MAISNIIKDVVLTANGRDARGDHSNSSALDKIAEDLSMVKTAQYLGVQGTAVRNGRCWQGCVRSKRAQGLSPSEAWTDCHEEWLKSIEGDASAWNKHASSDAWQSEPMNGSEGLRQVIAARLDSGEAPEVAIPSAIAEHTMAIPERLVFCADRLGKVASAIEDSDLAAAGRLRVAASVLRDEAWEITKKSIPSDEV